MKTFVSDWRTIGPSAAVSLFFSRKSLIPLYGTGSALRMKHYQHPFHFRHGTSDKLIMREVFVGQQYECVAHLAGCRVIADCGANIGAASVFLLHRYPDAEVFALEPDPGNFEILKKNLASFGTRAHTLPVALWSQDSGLRIERGNYRDGLEWTYQVRPCRDGEAPDVQGIGPLSLIQMCGGSIDLLKIDIERGELEVFSHTDPEWIAHVRNIVVELHDRQCRQAFEAAMINYDYTAEEVGELTVCRDIRLRQATIG
jgi:FkbM family methyltransferase